MIGLSLAVVHGIEAALWAPAFLRLGALDNAAEAMLFSIDSMTTRGVWPTISAHHKNAAFGLESRPLSFHWIGLSGLVTKLHTRRGARVRFLPVREHINQKEIGYV
jgi:hypothetical protein